MESSTTETKEVTTDENEGQKQKQQGKQQQQQKGKQQQQREKGGQQQKQAGQQQKQGGQQQKQGGQQQKQAGQQQKQAGQQQKQGGHQPRNQNSGDPKNQQQKQPAPGVDQPHQRKNSLNLAKKKQANVSSNKSVQFDNPQKRKEASKKQVVMKVFSEKQSLIFSHLPQYERPSSVSLSARISEPIHPAIVSLGLKFANKIIQGSNARCAALLDAFETFIGDYEPPPDKTLALDLDAKIKLIIQFLADCKPLSIGMGNIIKYLKMSIGTTTKMNVQEAKNYILSEITLCREQKVRAAGSLIVETGVQKITNGDVILTYGSSNVVKLILCEAHNNLKERNESFRVVVVDSHPKYEGRTMLNRLVSQGISCTYMLLTGIYYVKDVTKVLLGAHGLLSNGSVVSRCGTAVVAMVAHSKNTPVLVACETYKFHERVQLDSICQNELEDPESILLNTPESEINKKNKLEGWKENQMLKLLNMAYDVTPKEYVDAVITEVGMIPPTSVPVVIREAQQKLYQNDDQ